MGTYLLDTIALYMLMMSILAQPLEEIQAKALGTGQWQPCQLSHYELTSYRFAR